MSKYFHTGDDEEDSRIITDWFRNDGHHIADILIDDNQEYTDSNKEAAEMVDGLKEDLMKSCDSLKEFLLRKS